MLTTAHDRAHSLFTLDVARVVCERIRRFTAEDTFAAPAGPITVPVSFGVSASTPDTIFSAGSVGKLFTATAIMHLVEEGKIALDTPVADRLPGFSVKTRFSDAGPITIRNPLTHHSGLPSDFLLLVLSPSLGRDR